MHAGLTQQLPMCVCVCTPLFSSQERKKLLSFVIVGGGPTGVEVAAELHDLITEDLSKLYPDEVRLGLLAARCGDSSRR